MRGTKLFWCLMFVTILCSYQSNVSAQPTASQTAGGVAQQERMLEKSKSLESRIGQEKSAAGQATSEDVGLPTDSGAKVLVQTINVEGATLIASSVIQSIVEQYQGKELSLRQIQKIASLISDEYRKKGYLTSRAYVPPQKLEGGTLLIKVVEGKLGNVEVQGNRYFSTPLLKKSLNMQQGGYFDYSALQKSLVYINEHPDRTAKVVLVPGKVPGVTDVVMDVKDRMPIHAGFEYDNYGSRYINKSRYSTLLEHNNLTGHDDKLLVKFQTSEANYMRLYQGRYAIPLTPSFELGAYALASKLELGKEFEDLESRGKARIYGLFFNQAMVQEPTLDVRWNGGFDYKSVVNFLAEQKSSRDELRIVKTGLDIDAVDSWGRNILSPEVDFGFADILGGMEAKDPMASRTGAGAVFQKGVVNYYRLQPMPLSTSLLWKNSGQFSNQTLAASEQFQIGGPSSVRGYAPAEQSGDKGYYTALEWSLPLYGLSKDIKVPGRQETFYDATRLVTFWDWGYVNTKTPAAGDKEDNTLKGWGLGTRFNIKDISARFELGYPIGKNISADGRRPHPWVEVICKF
ncbi:MAG: ShlB/FhaC/HecB family hemolysin secretion/activation protein [Candidatus Omnitrophica bacterium]|nr:ShlB/FhaC/HecB family hemolysin secretion/activation protein [Candidatus Omnitrophota bacterium]